MSGENKLEKEHDLRSILYSIDDLRKSQRRNEELITGLSDAYKDLAREVQKMASVQTEFMTEAKYVNKDVSELRTLLEKYISDHETTRLENASIRADLRLFKWLLSGVSVVGLALFTGLIAWLKP